MREINKLWTEQLTVRLGRRNREHRAQSLSFEDDRDSFVECSFQRRREPTPGKKQHCQEPLTIQDDALEGSDKTDSAFLVLLLLFFVSVSIQQVLGVEVHTFRAQGKGSAS